jgi:NAD(P)-dependent dehydrogenase (short-subunit alcohol dehydrogenase family)
MFTDKTIIITGASSGIGKAIASEFLGHGANIVINARNEAQLQAFKTRNAQHASRIHIEAGDIARKSTGNALTKAALDRFGGLDVLINNAGVFVPKPFLEATEEDLEMYLSTALKGSFFAAQAAIPPMIENGGGSIINIGSMWVEHPLEATPCSASQVAKGGVHTLTRHLAIEFAANNIRVNTIAPAVIDTPLYDNLMNRDQLEELANLHPLRRLGSMKDVTSWVLHLAGEGGHFVSGQTLFLDGGITAGSHQP